MQQSAAPIPSALKFDPLAGIRKRFCATIVDKVLTFENLRKNINSDRNAMQALHEVSALAHKISGVAATLGFQEAGDLAGELERRLENTTRSGHPVSETWPSSEPVLDGLLDELESLLDD